MRSMTGFASEMKCTDKYDIFMELKSLNSRYFEFKLKSSSVLNEMELEMRNIIFERLERGKIDLYIKVVEKGADNYNVVVNQELAKKYEDAVLALSSKLGIVSDLNVRDFLMLDGIMNLERLGSDEELKSQLTQMLNTMIDRLIEMMYREGQKTKEDIQKSVGLILDSVKTIETLYPAALEKYKTTLKEKVQELMNSGIEENRVLMEVELMASRSAINEELVRLMSHISQFDKILSRKVDGDSKKLDFIAQEMHREANTIAAKSSDYQLIEKTIVIRGEIEKIREHLRNLV